MRERILAFVEDYQAERGYSPSVREVGAAVGLRSPATVHHHLRVLQAEGRIAWTPGWNRTLRRVA